MDRWAIEYPLEWVSREAEDAQRVLCRGPVGQSMKVVRPVRRLHGFAYACATELYRLAEKEDAVIEAHLTIVADYGNRRINADVLRDAAVRFAPTMSTVMERYRSVMQSYIDVGPLPAAIIQELLVKECVVATGAGLLPNSLRAAALAYTSLHSGCLHWAQHAAAEAVNQLGRQLLDGHSRSTTAVLDQIGPIERQHLPVNLVNQMCNSTRRAQRSFAITCARRELEQAELFGPKLRDMFLLCESARSRSQLEESLAQLRQLATRLNTNCEKELRAIKKIDQSPVGQLMASDISSSLAHRRVSAALCAVKATDDSELLAAVGVAYSAMAVEEETAMLAAYERIDQLFTQAYRSNR